MNIMKFRRLPVAVSLVGLLHFSTASAEIVTNLTIPLNDLTVFVPCANNGTGELVDLSGSFHIIATETISGSGNLMESTTVQMRVSGTGRSTGYKYQGGGTDRSQASFEGIQFPFVLSSQQALRVIGQGPGNNFIMRVHMHKTVNANGAVTAAVDNASAVCQ